MNRQKLDKSIMEVAKELARKWETQPMSVAYLVDGSMVSFINEKGITHIYLKNGLMALFMVVKLVCQLFIYRMTLQNTLGI